jgi:hypothetical protein
MENVKYKDYRIGKYIFTVRFQRRYDRSGPVVNVEVWEQHTPRKGFIYRLIEFFKYNRYWYGIWFAGNEPLENYAIRLCNFVANAMKEVDDAEKFWNDLDNE